MSAGWWARAGCLVTVALSLVAVPTAGAAPLRLDASFGEGGIAHVAFFAGIDPPSPLRPARQPDGKVIVAAAGLVGDNGWQTLLARFTRSGRPDPTFGHRGWRRLGYRWNFQPYAVHVQPDGRILVLGADGSPGQFGLARLLPDGSSDRSFGTNGFVAWNPPWRPDDVSLAAGPGVFVPQADGKVLAAGVVAERRPVGGLLGTFFNRVEFVRFNENGLVDESFGRAGVHEELQDTLFFFQKWAALPDGDIVALASGYDAFAPYGWWLVRFNHDGTLDQGFGQGGSVRLEQDLNHPRLYGLEFARDGGLLIRHRKTLRRIRPSGRLDTRFGTTCRRPPPSSFSWAGTASTPDGNLFAAGVTPVDRVRGTDGLFVRYDPRGCVAGRPLRVRAMPNVGPPLLQRRHIALVEAADPHGLSLIRIRR
jgi:serralysin